MKNTKDTSTKKKKYLKKKDWENNNQEKWKKYKQKYMKDIRSDEKNK